MNKSRAFKARRHTARVQRKQLKRTRQMHQRNRGSREVPRNDRKKRREQRPMKLFTPKIFSLPSVLERREHQRQKVVAA